MNRETIIDTEKATLWYYPDDKIIHHQFHKFIYGEEFQNVLLTGLDYFEKTGCVKWLSDDRNNSAIRKIDLQWGATYWKPNMVKVGWKYWAVLMPEMNVGKLSLQQLINEYKSHGVTTEIFSDVDEAYNWLKVVDKEVSKKI